MSTGHQPRRPTTEEWHRAASAISLPSSKLPATRSRPQPAPHQPSRRSPTKHRLFMTALGSIAAVAAVVWIAAIAGMCSPNTESEDRTIKTSVVSPKLVPTLTPSPPTTKVPKRSHSTTRHSLPIPTVDAMTVRQARPTPTLDPRSTGEIQGADQDYFIGVEFVAFENGRELFYQGRYGEALEEFKKAQKMRTAGQSAVLENWTALTYRMLGNHEKAIEHHTNAIGIKDTGADRVGRAASYVETGQWNPAIIDATAALEMEAQTTENFHSHVEAHALLAAWYSLQKEYSLTDDHASKALDIMDTMKYEPLLQAAVHKLKGVAQAALGHQKRSIETYSEAIIYGDDAQLRSLRANAYLAENLCPEAIKDANTALLMEPIHEVGYHSDADANTVLGVCSYQDGDLISAEQYLTEALAIMHGTEYQVKVTQYWTELLTQIRKDTGQ